MKHLLVLLALICLPAFPCGNPGEPSNCGDEVAQTGSEPRGKSDEFEKEVRKGRLRQKTNIALDGSINFAAYKLRQSGHKKEADQLLKEWNKKWYGYVNTVGRAPGDHSHAPLSQWLREKLDMLTLILGIQTMKATRLWDLVILNDSIPVVFRCIDNVDEAEFAEYFVPFASVVAYWTTFFTCVGFTWGSGFLFCGPLSFGVEMLVNNVVAPRLNPAIWKLSCQ